MMSDVPAEGVCWDTLNLNVHMFTDVSVCVHVSVFGD